MKKTFRRAIACLLAVLMVAFSMPFTALAADHNRQWWVDDDVDLSTVTAEPSYYNYYDETYGPDSGWESDETGAALAFGNELNDTILNGDTQIDTRDNAKPVIGIIVSNQGRAGANSSDISGCVYNNYYGQAAAKNYNTVKNAGNILNPAQLTAGQRIAVSIEIGGFDAFYWGQIKGTFDTDYLRPAKYSKAVNASNGDTWTAQTSASGAVLTNQIKYNGAALKNVSTNGLNVSNGTFMFQIESQSTSDSSVYVGSRTFGKYGMLIATISFEVLQDCNLKNVFGLVEDDPSVGRGGTQIMMYKSDYLVDNDWDNSTLSHITTNPSGTKYTHAIAPVIWDSYEEASAVTHTHDYDYANAVYTWNADNTACSAVATCTSTTGTCDDETVSATATNVSASADTADCTNGGQITYTATFASPFATQTKTVDTNPKGHTFTGAVAHYVDGTIDKHAATCADCDAIDTDNGVACTMEKQDTSIEPTCTTGGNYVFKCADCGYTVEQPQNATGVHINDYTDVVYTWAEDNSTCTATIGCQTCDGTAATVTVDANRSGGSAANCQQTADTTFTATFEDTNLTTQTKIVTGAAGPHDYDYANAVYTWDRTTGCSAVATCKYCSETATATATGVTSAEKTAATCTVMGTTTYTATFAAPFADQSKDVQDIPTIAHDYDYANAVYTWDGTSACSAVATCKNCPATDEAAATGVTSAEKTAPTCQVMGTTTYTATFAAPFAEQTKDVQDIATVDHNMVQTAAEIPATVDAPGKTAVEECSFECGTTEGGVEIPQLAHYVVTATAQNGTATVNDKATANIAPMGNVTLVATPASDDLTFVGWSLNDKIVSENPTYVTKAIADADYVAIFAAAETDNTVSTVVFTDEYSNVYGTQEVANGEFATAPVAPSLVGFTFAGWSVNGEIVDVATTAITENTTFVAVFERAATAQYTITVADGCQINGEAVTSKDFDYNDICTVTAPEGSVNGVWKVGDAVVGYGTSYTFFVGASATLTYVENESVAATPVVVAVSVERDPSSHRVAFLATRTTPAGYTYVNAGFVFGKNLADSDLDLDNVGEQGSNPDSGVVKALYCSTGVEQFRLSYGITAQTGTASAKAFLAYTDATGTHVIYGTFAPYTYA